MTLAMRVFLTFLAAYVLSQFYRSFLAVIAPELANELALDPQALGNLQAFWILGFVATLLPLGWALDTLGPRRTVSAQMLAAVAGALLFATAHSATALNIAMLLIGAGCGSIYMGAIYMFGRIAPPQRFALLCSWLLGIGTAGNLLAASPLAWAAQSIGWRGAMVGMAVATALSAASVLVLIRDPVRITSHCSRGLLGGIGTSALFHSLTLAKGNMPGVKGGYLGVLETYPSDMAQNFWLASFAFIACFTITLAVSLATARTKTDEELTGLVYSLTPKIVDQEVSWWLRPSVIGILLLLGCVILNVVFW